MPASDTSATRLPGAQQRQHRRRCARPRCARAAAAASAAMPSADSSRAVCRVSSHRIRSAACNVRHGARLTGRRGCRSASKPAQDLRGRAEGPSCGVIGEMRRMLRRAFVLLLGTLALAGCAGVRPARRVRAIPVPLGAGPAMGGRRARRRPGSGRHPAAAVRAERRARPGACCKAAQLALDAPGAPPLDARDTGGTPSGAAAAAQAAIAAGAGLILGPLTSAETAAVAPVARPAGVGGARLHQRPVAGAARRVDARHHARASRCAGWWRRRRRRASRGSPRCCRTTISAAPWRTALNQATADATALPPPDHPVPYARGMLPINAAMRDISRLRQPARADRCADPRGARARATPRGGARPQELGRSRRSRRRRSTRCCWPTPASRWPRSPRCCPITTSIPSAVRILGPALWASPSSGSGQFPRRVVCRPGPGGARRLRRRLHGANTAHRRRRSADLAYDAASIARVLAGNGGYSVARADPAGRVRRRRRRCSRCSRTARCGAGWRCSRSSAAARMVEPAPQTLSAPRGSERGCHPAAT